MIRRPPRSTQSRSSAASDVYKRQVPTLPEESIHAGAIADSTIDARAVFGEKLRCMAGRVTLVFHSDSALQQHLPDDMPFDIGPVSYTHLRAHETVLDLVCRLLLEKKKKKKKTKEE